METPVPVEVFASINFSEADFVKCQLQDRGINAWVTDPVADYPRVAARVSVSRTDYAAARSFVDQWTQRSTQR